MKEPVISIICNTYNQEKYIADALDSFLMQQVSVPFEILVHDDASTDKTADIIREYEKKYPNIIKPIYQTENQYSKEGLLTYRFQIPRAKGKYIAFCEGDDYWTDPHKLQLQYDFMTANSEYSACCHAYSMVDKDKNKLKDCHDFQSDCDIAFGRLLGNQLEIPQYATWFVRKLVLENCNGIFLGARCNDMVMRIICSLKGKIRYFNQNMSCYRRFTEGSWTMRCGMDKDILADKIKIRIKFMKDLNDYTNGKYNNEISVGIDKDEFTVDLLENRYSDARKREAFKTASIKKRLYIAVGCVSPQVINWLRKLKTITKSS